ncbi:MAG: hypothetical protein IJ007_03515 [Oscillospiraceae bacterium]|nr:hypothetical protein [Oscillospiraceae bacterium]
MKKYIAVILTAMLLCSCANENAGVTESVTIPTEATAAESSETSAETASVTEITTAAVSEKSAEKEPVPEKMTEFFYDLDFDGTDEKIVLEPRKYIACYDSDGNELGVESGQWCEQMNFITLKWYDDGENIYPALYSDYDCEFAYDEYYVILSLKDGIFTAERLITWGGLRENNNGVYGKVMMSYYSDVYGDWISKEKYREYASMVYDKLEDTPSYERSVLVKEALRQLKSDNISLDTYQVLSIDINSDDSDELVLFSDNVLYCFKKTEASVELAGKADFSEESFALEYYSDREKVFPVLKCEDSSGERFYRLSPDGEFKAEMFLQSADGKFYADGCEVSQDDFLRQKYFIWHKKQNRLEYTVEEAVEYDIYGTLYDVENDGIPELITGYYGAYNDIECGVVRLDGDSPKNTGGFNMNIDGVMRKYYDSVNDEYFYITECDYFGIASMSNSSADKTVFYSNTWDTETVASELYYYNSYSSEKADKIYLDSVCLCGEEIDGERYVDSIDMKLYRKPLEEYLAGFTLVDTVSVSEFMAERTYEDYKKQALEIERRYLENPSAVKVKALEQITIGDETVNINEKYIDIPADIPHAELEKLALLESLESVHIYGYNDEPPFDPELLKGAADRITSLTINADITDLEKLEMFPELVSFSINTAFDKQYDLSALSVLTGLEFLGVNGRITNLDFVKDMTKLKEIRFFAVSDEPDCFKAVAELPSLKVIVFSGMGDLPTSEQLEYLAERDDIIMPQLK